MTIVPAVPPSLTHISITSLLRAMSLFHLLHLFRLLGGLDQLVHTSSEPATILSRTTTQLRLHLLSKQSLIVVLIVGLVDTFDEGVKAIRLIPSRLPGRLLGRQSAAAVERRGRWWRWWFTPSTGIVQLAGNLWVIGIKKCRWGCDSSQGSIGEVPCWIIPRWGGRRSLGRGCSWGTGGAGVGAVN